MAEEAKGGMKDDDGAVAGEGAKKLQSVLRGARAVDVAPSIILTSPYRRARETAQIAAGILRGDSKLVDSPELIPESSPEAVWDAIRTHKAEQQLLLVGHEPLL